MSNTSNRFVYINDQASTVTWSAYNNKNIGFVRPAHGVGAYASGSGGFSNGHFAHFYLDYTYRNLSVEANRRLFIDANGGSTAPSTLSALSPILYLPMTEDYSIGENLGTGGDFTANGSPTIVQSGTQYEAGYGQGGLVWIKNRSQSLTHALFDTERGIHELLATNTTVGNDNKNTSVTAFIANGFTLGSAYEVNELSALNKYASWTFRKAEKFLMW